jgi:hypothetical protein
MDVMEALRAHGEAGAKVVDLLYGDAAEEVIKALSPQQKRERTQNRIATASNLVGIGAGVAATPSAAKEVKNAYGKLRPVKNDAPKVPRTGKLARFGTKAKDVADKPKVALGLAGLGLGLQVGNLVGDAVTNRVLDRTNKATEKKIRKSDDVVIQGELAPISKSDEKRQVFGWASVVKINGEDVSDLQDDEIDLEEIEKAAYNFVKDSRKGGNMHQKDLHVSDMIESMVVTPEKKKALGLPDDAPEGWWVGFKVNDDETWEDAKVGKLPMFSIHGTGRRG